MIVEYQKKFLQRSEFHEERRRFTLAPSVDMRLKKTCRRQRRAASLIDQKIRRLFTSRATSQIAEVADNT
jgi:hypothetical protein